MVLIGQRREKAIAAVADIASRSAGVRSSSTRRSRREGKDRKRYMLDKFGSEARIAEMHARIEPLGAAEGINFAFDAIKISPNTLDAHRVIRWAGSARRNGPGQARRAPLRLNFELGAISAAMPCSPRRGGKRAWIVPWSRAFCRPMRMSRPCATEIATASRMGVTGVPCFLLDGKYAVMGAQDAGTLVEALRQVAAEKLTAGVAEPTRTVSGCRSVRQARQLRHHHGGSGQPLLRGRPIANEDHTLVRPDLGERALFADEPHQTVRIGEFPLAELDHHTLRSGIELLDIGLAAEGLDVDDLEKVFDLVGQTAEPVDQFGAEGVDLFRGLQSPSRR